MYFNPMTLFILAEVALVMLIITGFLFHRSRLYRLLLALLTELRYKRALLLAKIESLQQKLRKLQSSATTPAAQPDTQTVLPPSKVSPPSTKQADTATADTLNNRLQQLLQTLNANSHLAAEDGLLQLLQMRHQLLDIEQSIDPKQELDPQLTEQLLHRYRTLFQHYPSLQPVDAIDPQHYHNLVHEHNQLKQTHLQMQQHLTEATQKLDKMLTIDSTIDDTALPPVSGEFTDEIYRLKCEKFDLTETINQLKVQLSGLDSAQSPIAYIETQEALVNEQARYIKEADISISLLEKEMDAAHKEIEQLRQQLKQAKHDVYALKSTAADQRSVSTDSIKQLACARDEQVLVVDQLKDGLTQLRHGDNIDNIIADQERHLATLTTHLKQSETCITVLEDELALANHKLETAQHTIHQLKEDLQAINPEEIQQMEQLLSRFIHDSQEMLGVIHTLEDENKLLKSHLEHLPQELNLP